MNETLAWVVYSILVIIIIGLVVKYYKSSSASNPTNSNPNKITTTPPVSSNTTGKGTLIEILKEGNGDEIKYANTITCHYSAWIKKPNGDLKLVDSSYDRGAPYSFDFGLRQVIPGWEDGMKEMKVGERRRLTIPPDLAYGKKGKREVPPNSIMVFEVVLLEFKKS